MSLSDGTVHRIFHATGDFNNDGNVDAADYVMWRYTFGQQSQPGVVRFFAADHSGPTPGQPNGIVDQFDYDFWRAHFGQTAGSGSTAGTNAVVPEPAMLVLLAIAVAGCCLRRHQSA